MWCESSHQRPRKGCLALTAVHPSSPRWAAACVQGVFRPQPGENPSSVDQAGARTNRTPSARSIWYGDVTPTPLAIAAFGILILRRPSLILS